MDATLSGRVKMAWQHAVTAFTQTAVAVGRLIASIEDPDAPGLGAWNLRELAAHTVRAATTLDAYLEEPVAGGQDLPDAAAYLAAYLDARDTDPDAMDAAVARRAARDAEGPGMEGIADTLARAVADLAPRLSAADPTRLVTTRFGTLRLDAYVRTRQLELVVHGFDLAAALDASFSPPPEALTDALHLLVEVAHARGRGETLLAAMTGRIPSAGALPILR